jgi:predicted outer membrane repeat protein
MPVSRSRLILAPSIAGLLFSATQAGAAIIFVNAAQVLPPAQQDGLTWATAYQDLRSALVASPTGSEFWIATGTYLPTTTTDRTKSFPVKANQKLLGGFLPGAARVTDRDPAAHPTILSGDIGAPGFADDNTRHVLQAGNAPGIVLDGLIIEDGANESSGTDGDGAGLRVTNVPGLLIQDCVVRRCSTPARGGGASFLNADGAILRRVTFEQNFGGVGGALDMQSAPMTYAACRFLGNTSTSGPGAVIAVSSSGSLFVNCEFSGNSTQGIGGAGGGALSLNAGMAIHSSTFVGNTATTNGGAITTSLSANSASITNCLFVDNTAPSSPHIQTVGNVPITSCGFSDAPVGGAGNGVVLPGLRDPLGPDGTRGTVDDDLRLTSGSEAIDRGNGAALPTDVADLDSDGDVSEPLPVDAKGLVRLVDDQRQDEGSGASPFLDLGAHEFERSTRIYFVDASVEEDGTGNSWEKAFQKLQSAFIAIQSEPQPKPVEVWVADGIYVPGANRTDSFMPQGAVTILGGFKGGEWRRSDRRPLEFPTVLSGAIGSKGSNDDNSLHVVHFAGDNVFAETVLDGFVITGGNANEPEPFGTFGGGILVTGVARPTIRNCRVIDNAAKVGGGGITVSGSGSRVDLTNCYVAGNTGSSVGGGVLLMDAADGSTIVNCTVAGNRSESGGGLVALGAGSSACVLNTVFAENLSEDGETENDHVATRDGGSLSLSHCAIPCGGTISFGNNLVSLPPAFTWLAGADEVIGTLDDDFSLSATSACIDAGASVASCAALLPSDVSDLDDDANVSESIPVDALGSPRIMDDPLRNNADPSMAIDIGAAERQDPSRTAGLPGDLDGNGKVNGADLAMFLGEWGSSSQMADLNGDCQVDAADLAVLLGGWTI